LHHVFVFVHEKHTLMNYGSQDFNILHYRGEMVITTIGNEDCRSLGDAMRDLDAKGLLRSDFILISTGDTISNVNLLPILEQHK
jgi:hypothetical protein